jgi:hypothetical protein
MITAIYAQMRNENERATTIVDRLKLLQPWIHISSAQVSNAISSLIDEIRNIEKVKEMLRAKAKEKEQEEKQHDAGARKILRKMAVENAKEAVIHIKSILANTANYKKVHAAYRAAKEVQAELDLKKIAAPEISQ